MDGTTDSLEVIFEKSRLVGLRAVLYFPCGKFGLHNN